MESSTGLLFSILVFGRLAFKLTRGKAFFFGWQASFLSKCKAEQQFGSLSLCAQTHIPSKMPYGKGLSKLGGAFGIPQHRSGSKRAFRPWGF